MELIISNRTNVPIYEQITKQIKDMVVSGLLAPGEPLPSMRSLAKSLQVSVITVQKAYDDLQREGFIDSTVGRGTFVAAVDNEFLQQQHRQEIERHLREAAQLAVSAGLPRERLITLLSAAFEEEKR